MGLFNTFWNWRTAAHTRESARTLKRIESRGRVQGMDSNERRQVRSTRKLAKEYRKNGDLK